jgi:hypothetical protein
MRGGGCLLLLGAPTASAAVRPWWNGLLGPDLGPFGPELGRQASVWWPGGSGEATSRWWWRTLATAAWPWRRGLPGPVLGPIDYSLVEVVLACWGMPVRRCSWSLKWAATVVHDLDAWLLSYWRLSGLSLQAGSVSNLLNGSYGHLEGGGVNRCYSNFNSFSN